MKEKALFMLEYLLNINILLQCCKFLILKLLYMWILGEAIASLASMVATALAHLKWPIHMHEFLQKSIKQQVGHQMIWSFESIEIFIVD